MDTDRFKFNSELGVLLDTRYSRFYSHVNQTLAKNLGINWSEFKIYVDKFTGWENITAASYKVEFLQTPTFEEFNGGQEKYIVKNTRKFANFLSRIGNEEKSNFTYESAQIARDFILRNGFLCSYLSNYLIKTRFINRDAFNLFRAHYDELKYISNLFQCIHNATWAKHVPQCFQWLKTVGRLASKKFYEADEIKFYIGHVQQSTQIFSGNGLKAYKISAVELDEPPKKSYQLPEAISSQVAKYFKLLCVKNALDVPFETEEFAHISSATSHPFYIITAHKFKLCDVSNGDLEFAHKHIEALYEVWLM